MKWLPIALLALVGIALLCGIVKLAQALHRAGSALSGILSLLRKSEGMNMEEGPRSISAADRLLLPQVQRDFPEYNPELVLARVKQDAFTYYDSAREGRVLYKEGISHALRRTLPETLPKDVAGGIAVHRAALSAYDTAAEDKILTFQAAVEYRNSAGTLRQRKLTLKYMAAFSEDLEADVHSFNCPSCGAPIPAIDEKRCQYCGSALKVPAALGWYLISLKDS